jgi:G3E family GTPase
MQTNPSGIDGPIGRIPVSLLTGFLGAGKTTLLNHLVQDPSMKGTALLINEFGAVGIDHHLVEKIDDTTVLLDSGCVCCNVQGDLVKALKQLHQRSSRREIPPIARVILETTGLADPVPVIYTLMEERFVAARYVCDGVMTVVDASHGLAQLDRHQEAVRQVALADRLLITKGDLTNTVQRAKLETRLETLNPGARRIDVRHGKVALEDLFSSGIYAPEGKLPDVAAWLGEERERHAPARVTPTTPMHWRKSGTPHTAAERHDSSVSSFVVRFETPVPWLGFAAAMGRILDTYGPRLLRVKGLMNVVGDPKPQIIQCVQNVAYPPVALPKWPNGGPFDDHCGRLVFITHDINDDDIETVRQLLKTLPGDAAAIRATAAMPLLPTRCWFARRTMARETGSIELDGWTVQPKRFGRQTSESSR